MLNLISGNGYDTLFHHYNGLSILRRDLPLRIFLLPLLDHLHKVVSLHRSHLFRFSCRFLYTFWHLRNTERFEYFGTVLMIAYGFLRL